MLLVASDFLLSPLWAVRGILIGTKTFVTVLRNSEFHLLQVRKILSERFPRDVFSKTLKYI